MTFFFPFSAVNNRGLRGMANHVEVDGANLRTSALAKIIHRGFDVLRRRTQRHEDRVRVGGLIGAQHAVIAAGQLSEIRVGLFEELRDRFGEVVAARGDALHVVFLVLHRPEQHGVGEIDHARHPATLRTEQDALALGGTIDDVVGRAQVFADQFRLVLVESALQVVVRKPSLMFMPGVRLSSVTRRRISAWSAACCASLPNSMIQSRIERAVDIVMAAVHVERVLGQRARDHLQHHRRALARRVIILLQRRTRFLGRR